MQSHHQEGRKHLNILLADDDSDDRMFFKSALTELRLNASLSTVVDGEELMAMLGNSQNKLPDVLYLDLNMPRKNGFECLTEIKKHVHLKSMPVIIFSTSYEQDVVNLLYKSGALYFMRKPPEFSQLKKIIEMTANLILHGSEERPDRESFVLTV